MLPPSHPPQCAPAFDAVILAAGASTRFFRSGGTVFKQVVPYKGTPVIRYLYDILAALPGVDQVHVVLGDNPDCAQAIRDVLPEDNIHFWVNPDSARDNNLLSFQHGTQHLDKGVIVVEADCVLSEADLLNILANCQSNQICWANIGQIDTYDYGGVLETNILGEVISVDVLTANEMAQFKDANRTGFKLFGVAAFGQEALQIYLGIITARSDCYNQYFHIIATENPERFNFRTVEMSQSSFSFNIVSELENA